MRLVEISAWNDSGGGFLNRLLDGHPALTTWPFELLLGSDGSTPDCFGESWFRGRFRWPRLGDVAVADGAALFDRISDRELKSLLADPQGAKHAAFPVDVELSAWRGTLAAAWAAETAKTQANFIRLYVSTFFSLWHGRPLDRNLRVLGHCPVAVLDAPEIWADFPDAQIIHVVRAPEPGFHDMRLRHRDLRADGYALKWNIVNGFAAALAAKHPARVRLLTLNDLLTRREETLVALCDWLGIGFDDSVLAPSWCDIPLDPLDMGPFGGVPAASADVECGLADRLADAERETIIRTCAGTRDVLRSLHHIAV